MTPGEQAQVYGTMGTSDTIQFNLPAGPQTITLTGGALSITHPVTISGPGAGSLTINGNNVLEASKPDLERACQAAREKAEAAA